MLQTLLERSSPDHPFFISHDNHTLNILDLSLHERPSILAPVTPGDVVALIGNYDSTSISLLIHLLSLSAIVVPLTHETLGQHEYFLTTSCANYVIDTRQFPLQLVSLASPATQSPLLSEFKLLRKAGLILFTSGSTGKPKAILHDLDTLLSRYTELRPALRSLSFLQFDHIGGLNTLFHMMFNFGTVVSIPSVGVSDVIRTINHHNIELLPATPTFLRLLSLYPGLSPQLLPSLKIISYGTERMDPFTLETLCDLLPEVSIKQTYGMSELGILRIASQSRNSLYIKVAGSFVETKIVDGILYIRSSSRMVGYLNAPSPFDGHGWYCTNDIVEQGSDGYFKIVGRNSDFINVAGLKFLPREVELVVLKYSGVLYAKVVGVDNPITGQYVSLLIEPSRESFDLDDFTGYLKSNLPRHMFPSSIRLGKVPVSHRMKQL